MKHPILIAFIISFFADTAGAQNWRLIQHEKIPLYCSTSDSLIYAAIKADSVIALPNGDSMLFNYRVENPDCDCVDWGYTGTPCGFHGGKGSFNMRDTGWLGLPVIISGNQYCFLNYRQDSIFIRPNANYGASWKFMTVDSTHYIRAKVTASYVANVLGQSDSIKEISLTLRDSSGALITTSWTAGHKIIISKGHGLLSGFYFYYFDPLGSNPFRYSHNVFLAGFQEGEGIKIPTNATIYNMAVGDRFEYAGSVIRQSTVALAFTNPTDWYHVWRTVKSKMVLQD